MAYELVYEKTESDGWWYVGHAEECTFEMSGPPEQVPGADIIVRTTIDGLIEAIEAEHGKLLKCEIWSDIEPTWETKWLVKCTAHGSPLAWAPIIAVLALIVVIIGLVALVLMNVEDLNWIGPVAIAAGIGVAALGVAAVVREVRRK